MSEVNSARRRQRRLPWLLLLFIGSGCAALVYEIVWLQLLQLVIGLTNVSLGVLLGIFMGGMCLGSLLLPRLLSPRHHPLRVYACLELGIGLAGIAVLFIVPAVSNFYTAHAGPGVTGLILRGCVAAVCLLPPTVMMGATLPAIARWIEMSREGVSWLGFFYGGNIVGAVAGCWIAGFYLLRTFDMATATYAAAAINFTVAMVAFGLSSHTARCQMDSPPNEPDNGQRGIIPTPSTTLKPVAVDGRRSVYVAIALSGMSALGAEVIWTRWLSLVMGGTVYTFSIILSTFLIGLGLGSGAGSFLARTVSRPRLALGACQLTLVPAAAWAGFMVNRSLPYWPVDPSLALSPWFTFQLDLTRCLWAVLPSALLWGASFPLALAAVARTADDSGRLVGGVYAANTVGAIVGALAFSLLFIPQWGTQTSQRILLGVAALSAAIVLGLPSSNRQTATAEPGVSRHRLGITAGALACLAIVALLVGTVSTVPWGVVAYGRFAATYAARLAPGLTPEALVPLGATSPDIYCSYVGEGLNGSIAVTKWTSGVRNFHSAGKVQASNDPHDMRLQRMLGHLSALAHANPESVLVVACGAGVTAGTFVTQPATKRIVICDIEPLVPNYVAPMFAEENYNVVKDPRTQVVSDDGRHFIRTTHEKFDIITSDPIDPWVKGCAALNTVEYYEMCKAHLKPGGVMSLWIPLYESSPEAVKSIVATFFKVFPHGIIWSNDIGGEGYDAVLFGQVEPTQFDLDQMQARIDRPEYSRVKKSLADVGFHTAVDLLSTYAGQAADLGDWTRGAQINTDANLRLQYLAGWAVNSYRGAEILKGIEQNRRFPENLFVGSESKKMLLRARLLKLADGSTSVDQRRALAGAQR